MGAECIAGHFDACDEACSLRQSCRIDAVPALIGVADLQRQTVGNGLLVRIAGDLQHSAVKHAFHQILHRCRSGKRHRHH